MFLGDRPDCSGDHRKPQAVSPSSGSEQPCRRMELTIAGSGLRNGIGDCHIHRQAVDSVRAAASLEQTSPAGITARRLLFSRVSLLPAARLSAFPHVERQGYSVAVLFRETRAEVPEHLPLARSRL
jgi:hypothetical protein